jgi:hypothetical protein
MCNKKDTFALFLHYKNTELFQIVLNYEKNSKKQRNIEKMHSSSL